MPMYFECNRSEVGITRSRNFIIESGSYAWPEPLNEFVWSTICNLGTWLNVDFVLHVTFQAFIFQFLARPSRVRSDWVKTSCWHSATVCSPEAWGISDDIMAATRRTTALGQVIADGKYTANEQVMKPWMVTGATPAWASYCDESWTRPSRRNVIFQ